MKRFFKNDIRERVNILSIIPMLVITIILGTFFIYSQIQNTKMGMIEKGTEFSKLLSIAAEFGVLSNNPAELNHLSQQLTQNPLIKDVIFTDDSLSIIHRKKDFDITISIPPDPILYDHEIWFFSHPITPMPIRVDENNIQTDNTYNEEAIGWVIIAFSDEPIQLQQYQIIRNGVLIILAGFLVTFLISNYFGRKISHPIKQLSIIINQLRRGNLKARASSSDTNEFNQLAEGINELAMSLEESNNQMESRIYQATQALSVSLQELEIKNNQLMKAHQKADAANRAKDAFLARMSHELRTPLTSVIGFTRMIQEGSSEEERVHFLQIIDHTSQMLLTLIDDLLDFTRLEAEAIELETLSFQPEKLFHQALEMQAPIAHNKGIELVLEGAHEIPSLLQGDPTRIRQIVTNLISNAIKFTDRGYIKLCTGYSRIDSSLQIEVQDTGIGITPQYKEKMFDSFTQADNSISRKYGGSGLGLAIVYRLVKLMNGEIEVDSTLEKGTTFSITLPINQDKLILDSKQISEITTVNEAFDLNILLIESNSASRKSIYEILSFFSIQCSTHERIEDALKKKEKYTHILISHSPTENTELLFRKSKSINQHFPNTKLCILLPANIKRDSIRNIDAKIITKPISPNQLINQLIKQEENNALEQNNKNKLEALEILIAEDNDYNRLLVKRILHQSGIKTREAVTGKEAITEVNRSMPDIILMDINMPDIDGIEASKVILENNPNANIIALTANIAPREQQMLNKIGIDRILLKPLNIEKLYALLSTLNIKQSSSAGSNQNLIEFKNELKKQLEEIQSRIYAKDYESIARNAHQLYGFAGIFDYPEIELVAERLKKAVLGREIRNIWSAYNQLSRVIDNIKEF